MSLLSAIISDIFTTLLHPIIQWLGLTHQNQLQYLDSTGGLLILRTASSPPCILRHHDEVQPPKTFTILAINLHVHSPDWNPRQYNFLWMCLHKITVSWIMSDIMTALVLSAHPWAQVAICSRSEEIPLRNRLQKNETHRGMDDPKTERLQPRLSMTRRRRSICVRWWQRVVKL